MARELAEETGLSVLVGPLVHLEDFEVLPGCWVVIEAYRCDPRGPLDAERSGEHVEVAWFALEDLPQNLPAVYRRAIVEASDT